jgi:hypothetical protein
LCQKSVSKRANGRGWGGNVVGACDGLRAGRGCAPIFDGERRASVDEIDAHSAHEPDAACHWSMKGGGLAQRELGAWGALGPAGAGSVVAGFRLLRPYSVGEGVKGRRCDTDPRRVLAIAWNACRATFGTSCTLPSRPIAHCHHVPSAIIRHPSMQTGAIAHRKFSQSQMCSGGGEIKFKYPYAGLLAKISACLNGTSAS